ncbi:hypothetical protein D3C80_1463450 [compost metagenome]
MYFQRAIAGIGREHQLFALFCIKATLLVARRDTGFFRNDPDLIQVQFFRFARVVFRVTYTGPCAHDLEFTRRNLLFVTHAVFVRHGTFEYIGQNFHVFVRVSAEALACVNHIIVNHAQCREAHEIRVVIVSKREGMPGVQPAMICVTTFVSFA